ncbi:MAG: DUF2877 domain-containing protein [Nocardioidaceae bacterium]|nr:DUF2877 domain-containing protein [Nocardioidaceae bacterium]NUS50509.1 DUF2877 domain-containing protein [Nocardioidaceae bacterium]
MSLPLPCAASSLLAGLVDGPAPALTEVARTPVSVHFDTGRDDVPVLCVATPRAVRLPNAVLVAHLPDDPPAGFRVTRWWRPARPRGVVAPVRTLAVEPSSLIGAGPGLTPRGDDVLAGALVAAYAVGHTQRDRLVEDTRTALRTRTTTAVSRGLLTHALDGWAVPELAAYVVALGVGDPGSALERLLGVGHTSGAALAEGVHLVVDREPAGAAA